MVLPGAGYSCWQPLLHFTIKVLLKKRVRVLALDKIYADDPNWMKLTSREEARQIVEDDMTQVFKAIPKQISAEPRTIVARSLGTYAVACLLEKELIRPTQIVWQTPALGDKWSIICGIDFQFPTKFPLRHPFFVEHFRKAQLYHYFTLRRVLLLCKLAYMSSPIEMKSQSTPKKLIRLFANQMRAFSIAHKIRSFGRGSQTVEYGPRNSGSVSARR